MANPTQWRVNPSNASNATQLPAAYTFGVEAQDYTVLPVDPLNDSNTQGSDTTIFRGDNYWEYPFLNRNLKHLHPNGLVSTRTVRASATCTQLSVMPTWIIDSGRYYMNASKDDMHWLPYEISVWVEGDLIKYGVACPGNCPGADLRKIIRSIYICTGYVCRFGSRSRRRQRDQAYCCIETDWE